MKRSIFTMTIATLLVVAVTMAAEAQRQGGRGQGGRGGPGGQQGGRGGPGGMMMMGGRMGGGGGLLQLAQNKAVQKEIDALEDQVEKITKLAEELRGERPDFSGVREMSEEDRTKFFEKMQKERAEQAKKGDKALADILIGPQIDRLNEIRVQQLGRMGVGRALMDDKVAAKLELGSKKAEIATAMGKMGEEMRAIFQSGDRENMREKMTELREKSDAEVLGLLSADQKKAFESMKGDPFEMPRSQRGGQRGGDRSGDRPQRKQRPGI